MYVCMFIVRFNNENTIRKEWHAVYENQLFLAIKKFAVVYYW